MEKMVCKMLSPELVCLARCSAYGDLLKKEDISPRKAEVLFREAIFEYLETIIIESESEEF